MMNTTKSTFTIVSALVITLFLTTSQSLIGKNYYFSALNGNDGYTSIQAQNQSTPWKSINKLNSFFGSLLPGDSVLFKRGDIFSGTIKVGMSGTSALPIVIGAYGAGINPVISGFQTVTGWANLGNNIWESSAISCKPTLNMISVNGINTPVGRYPNAGTSNGGYLTYETANAATSSITDNQLTATPNWTGAEAVVRKTAWIINRCPITKHVNGTLTLTDPSGYAGYNDGWGYFIQNDIRTLDVTGEWFLNKNTKKLSMYFSGNNPNSYMVKASILDTLVFSSGKSYLTFTNLTFEGGNLYAFYINGGDHIQIRNCNIGYIGKDAIDYTNHPYFTVFGCNISNVNDNAIFGASNSYNAYVGYCNLRNNYVIPGNTGVGDGHGFGISFRADNCIAENNTINNVGYLGILIAGNNTIVRNNYIDSACLMKDDGGAIYISGAIPAIMSGRKIQNNIITNSLGNAYGKSAVYTAKANGIYIDGYGNNVLIEGNTVTNASSGGIYMGFYSHDIQIINNTLYNNSDNLKITENDLVDNKCIFNGNIFATDGSTGLFSAINGSETKVYRPIESFGTWSGNYFIKPFDDKNVLFIRYNIGTKQIFDGVTFDGWKRYDATRKGPPIAIEPYKLNSLIGSNKFSNGNFTSNTTGLSSSYNASAKLNWDNTNKISGGSAQLIYNLPLSTTNDAAILSFNVGSVTAGKKYILKFDLLGSNPDRAVEVYIRKSASPYTSLTPRDKYYPFTTTKTTNEILIEPTGSDLSTEVLLSFRDEDGTVYLDNVSFTEADVTKTNPNDIMRLEYNGTNSIKTIPLPNPFIAADGKIYTSSITLLPFTSALLFKSPYAVANEAPVILNQNFQLNENSINGTIVGSVIATDPNAGQTLTYSIISGNTSSAFSINAATGILTVANSAALDFETIPSFPLVVRVQDNGSGNLTSQATISITLLNVNEKPVINNQTFSTQANALNGTVVGTVLASDPDAGQTKTYSILSGNLNNAFIINPTTGVLSVSSSASLNYLTTPTFSLVIKVQDNGTGSLSSQATITVNLTVVNGCSATGTISYLVWNNIGNSKTISSLTGSINYPDNPTSSTLITSMEGSPNLSDGFGARIVGFICAPSTGSYTFWIASDDNGELWLSTNDQPSAKQLIAYHNGATLPRQWNKYATQKSISINLIQGQKYFIEALMKDGSGDDNLAVGWSQPGEAETQPSEIIPGSVLSPFIPIQVVPINSISILSSAIINSGSSITISPNVLPADATNTFLAWSTSNALVAKVDNNGVVTGIAEGNAIITATSTDGSNNSGTCSVTVNSIVCSATGNITYQVWNNIGNSKTISSLTGNINYPDNPTSSKLITSMEGTTNLSDGFGARIAGYICAPSTGSYTFWIASDDNGELWLSSNDQPSAKQLIAYHTGATLPRQWNKYATQKSISINLIQGQRYFIEALMKDGSGDDNLSVGWLKPGQSGAIPSEVIPGSVLSAFGADSRVMVSSVKLPLTYSLNVGSDVMLLATVLPTNSLDKTLRWTSGNPAIATVNDNGIVSGIAEGKATITATSTDGSNISGTCSVTVNPLICSASGNITYQVWENIGSSKLVSSLTGNINYPNNPTSSTLITSMEGTTNLSDGFGARIAGYICAPITGSYTFWIASDDNGELWLSTNDQPSAKQLIAYHTGATLPKQWDKYATQKSISINLIQGQRYFIEVLMKDGSGGDNIAVGWSKPGETDARPTEVIPGSVLSPIGLKSKEVLIDHPVLSESNINLLVYPNPLNNDVLNIKIENISSEAYLRIYSATGILCYEELIHNTETIHLDRSVFKSGIYVIRVFNNDFVKSTKLIVK